MSVRKVYTTSTEFLVVEVTASETLSAQPVEISVDNQQTWLTGAWIGDPGTTRSARVLLTSGSNMPTAGERPAFVRLTDSPEVPVFATSGTVRFI